MTTGQCPITIACSSASSARRPAALGATGSTSARAARALAIAQRHELPELLARILAGRNVEIDAVEAFLDPTIKRAMPDPDVLTGDDGGGGAPRRRGHARRDASRSSATTTSTARPRRRCWRAFCATRGIEPLIHIPDRLFEGYGPNVEAVRALAERGATLLVTVDCGTTSIEPLAEAQRARPRRRRHRPPSGRRGAAAGASRSSIRTGATISPGSAISPPSVSCS